MNTPESFADILDRYGRRLDDAGCTETALTRHYALLAIEALSETEGVILGGDVWDLVDGSPQPAYANWHSDRRRGETNKEYRERSWDEAKEYISNYRDPEDGTVLYTLVVHYMPGDRAIL